MKRERKEIEARRQKIVDLLATDGYKDVNDLSEKLGVSLITIRRDLDYLEKKKLLKRYHGGARLSNQKNLRITQNREDEILRKIGMKAAEFVKKDGQVLLANGGQTTRQVIMQITHSAIVLTSNARVLEGDLQNASIKVIYTGGELVKEKDTFVGQFTINSIDSIVADICFLGVNAISAESGLTSSSMDRIMVNQRMLERTKGPKIVVAEGKKIGTTTSFSVCPVNKITHLITDASADKNEIEKIRKQGVSVIVV